MKFRNALSIVLVFAMTLFVYSYSLGNSPNICFEPCGGNVSQPPYSLTSGGSAGSTSLMRSGEVQTFDYDALNIIRLKTNDSIGRSKGQGQRSSMNSAITITRNDFDLFSQPRNTWLDFQNELDVLSLDIGIENNATSQIWTLPNDLLDYFEYVFYDDFIPPSEVPAELAFEGTNKVLKSYYLDNQDNLIEIYQHYILGESEIDLIGTSFYYFLDGDEDIFDSDDSKISDVPMSLGDGYAFVEQAPNYLIEYHNSKSVDAYGVLETGFGDFECLRYSISTDIYSRPDTMSEFTYESSFTRVGFVTKDGFHFSGDVSAASGTVGMTNFQLQFVVASGLLSDSEEIQINNDGYGVAINEDNLAADPSAVLDVSSDSLGILIPRMEQNNRPSDPAEGLLIYQSDGDPGFYYFDGIEWLKIMTVAPSSSPPPSGQGQTESNTSTPQKKSSIKQKNK